MRVEDKIFVTLKGAVVTGTEKKEETTVTTIDEAVHYVAKTNDGWGIAMTGLDADDGSDSDHAGVFGMPMINFKIEGNRVKKARIKNQRGKWLKYGSGFDTELGNDTDITGIEIVGKGLVFAVHIKGGTWLNPVRTSDVDGEVLVGNGAVIDAIWIDEI